MLQNQEFDYLNSLQCLKKQVTIKNSQNEENKQKKQGVIRNIIPVLKNQKKQKDIQMINMINEKRHLGDKQKESSMIFKNSEILKKKNIKEKNEYSKSKSIFRLLGGGCGSFKDAAQPDKSSQGGELNKRFLKKYQKLTDKKKIFENIESHLQTELQLTIFRECLHKFWDDIKSNIQGYKPKILELIDVYQIYVLAEDDETKKLDSEKYDELIKMIDTMKKLFQKNSTAQPTLDLVYHFEMLSELTKIRKSQLRNEQVLQFAKIFQKIASIGFAIYKLDIVTLATSAFEIGKSVCSYLKSSKYKKIQSNIIKIYEEKFAKFKENIWQLNILQEISYYIELFTGMDLKQEQDPDYILLLLSKISYFLIKTKGKKEDIKILQKELNFNNDLIKKLLSKVSSKLEKGKSDENIFIRFFCLKDFKSPTYRYLVNSILLYYNELMQEVKGFEKEMNDLVADLSFKKLSEKDTSVKLAYDNDENFEKVYEQKMKEEGQELQKEILKIAQTRKEVFKEKQLQDMETEITTLEDIAKLDQIYKEDKMIRDQLRELMQNSEEIQELLDDIVDEIKNLYIEQSITYLKGKNIFLEKDNKKKALMQIQENFLNSNQQDCKILGILSEASTGKSMLLKKLETDFGDNKSTENTKYITILIKCNLINPINPTIESYLKQIQKKKKKEIQRLKDSDLNKLILLDGYDEYQGEQFRIYSQFSLKDWKNTKVIVTARSDKLTKSDACNYFSKYDENGNRIENSFSIVELNKLSKEDRISYFDKYIKQRRNEQEQVNIEYGKENEQGNAKDEGLEIQKKQMKKFEDCLKSNQLKSLLENLLKSPINLYFFSGIVYDYEEQKELEKILEKNIHDQESLHNYFYQKQFERETKVLLEKNEQFEHFTQDKDEVKQQNLIINCYFEYFQTIAIQMFKNQKGTKNYFSAVNEEMKFSVNKKYQEELSQTQKEELIKNIKKYMNQKIITRSRQIFKENTESEEIEFKHKSQFEYFVLRALKYDFDIHGDNIYKLSVEDLKQFSICQKPFMQKDQKYSEQKILIKFFKLIKSEIESKEFQLSCKEQDIYECNKYIQYVRKSTIYKSDEKSLIDTGASNLITAMFLSKCSFPKLKLSLCSLSKAYICNPKSNDIRFDNCNLQDAYLKNCDINYNFCNTSSANIDSVSKIFDMRNIYSFQQVLWGQNNLLYTISESGFINSFQIDHQNIKLKKSKQLSITPLSQIKLLEDGTLVVSSQQCLTLINSNSFDINRTKAFQSSIKQITLINKEIIVTLENGKLFYGSFGEDFSKLNIEGKGCVYYPQKKQLITHNKSSLSKYDQTFKYIKSIETSSNINCLALSGDGKYIATGSEDKTCKIYNPDTLELMFTNLGHSKPIHSLCFSEKTKYLITGSEDKTFKIWDTEKFNLINTLGQQRHTDRISSISFSLDGKYLATSSDQNCNIWNAEKSFLCFKSIQGHTKTIHSVAYSKNGMYLATGSEDQTCKIWDAKSKDFPLIHTTEKDQTKKGHTDRISSVDFSKDGKYLASGSWDKTCKIWNVSHQFDIFHTIGDHTEAIYSIQFSENGKFLATGSKDNTCKIWNAEKKFEPIKTIQEHTGAIYSVSFSANGKYLATGSKDKTCNIWNAEKNFELIKSIKEHTGAIFSVSFSPNGKFIATGSEDQTCKIWNVDKQFQLIKTIQCHNDRIFFVAFSADGKYLATESSDFTCKIWNAENQFKYVSTIQGHTDRITSVSFSEDKKQLVTGSCDQTFKVWNIENGLEPNNMIQSHSDNISTCAFSVDRKYLMTASLDQTLKIWNTENGFELTKTIQGQVHTDIISSIAFSPDLKRFATGSHDQTCNIWKLEEKLEEKQEEESKPIQKIEGHTQGISFVTFSGNGKYLTTISYDKTCRILNAQSKFELIKKIEDHSETISCVAFSANQKFLATGSWDKTCKLWNAEKEFELIKTIQGHIHPIFSVSFSEDGKYLATGSYDRTCKIWNTEKDFEFIDTIIGHSRTISSVAFSSDGSYLVTGSYDQTLKIWNAKDGFKLIETVQYNNEINLLSFSKVFSENTQYLSICFRDQTCKILQFSDGKIL